MDHYVNSLRFFQSGSMVSMNSDTLMSLVNLLSEEDLSEASYEPGAVRVRDSLMQRGMKARAAAAIMAQLVASSGIADASSFPDIILIVIIVSVIISSVGSSYLKSRGQAINYTGNE